MNHTTQSHIRFRLPKWKEGLKCSRCKAPLEVEDSYDGLGAWVCGNCADDLAREETDSEERDEW